MMKLIRFLITGSWHDHKFEIIKSGNLTRDGSVIGMRYISRCNECGKIKHKDCN